MDIANNKKKTAYLDVLRWIATIDVIVYHVLNAASSYVDLSTTQTIATLVLTPMMRFHVPLFLMISGALFLNPEREFTYKNIGRYIKRILLALLIFGYPMALIEEYFITHTISPSLFSVAFGNLISGRTWSHMWYLYMLIGLYLLIPIIKCFTDKATKKEKQIVIAIMFAFLILKGFVETITGITIGFSLPITSFVVFYFVLGDYVEREVENIEKGKWLSITGIIICIVIIVLNGVNNWNIPLQTHSPVIAILTCSFFVLCKTMNIVNDRLSRTKNLTFGMYLTHMFAVNFIYKFLKVTPYDFPLVISIPVFVLIFTVFAFVVSWLLNKIPLMRKYVL